MEVEKSRVDALKQFLIDRYGNEEHFRIDRGIDQVVNFWQEEDGSFEELQKFCKENFIPKSEKLDKLFSRLERNFEILYGYFNKISLELKKPLHLNWGDILPIDQSFGAFEPSAHLFDDLFKTKIAFLVLLNFPSYSLEEKIKNAEQWSRKEWAFVRMGDIFLSRVPAKLNQEISEALTAAETYISEYNIYASNLINNSGKKMFPPDLVLLSHWNIRDEIKSLYKEKDGLEKQELLYAVIKRIVNQDIPVKVINNGDFLWNPVKNKVFKGNKEERWTPEPNTRYLHLKNIFNVLKKLDAYYPLYPSHIHRSFELQREIPEKEVEELFLKVLTSQEIRRLGKYIQKKLKRNLHPFDIWYNGLKSSESLNEEQLNKIVQKRYPTVGDFQREIKSILLKLGFGEKNSETISSRIYVEAARGSGHAWGPERKGEKAYLRTRIPENGMNYKGYNIAIHELGHNVEQVLTIYNVDYYMLRGVPNTAFTEAFAFSFQKRDLELLGVGNQRKDNEDLEVLDSLWQTYEIMGVALVDMYVWRWMYQNPAASIKELRNAVLNIACDVWNKYYSDVFNLKDEPILAIYSHMIDAALYLPDYPLGHLIEFQINQFLKNRVLGEEMMRMCQTGKVIPQLWMKKAVGKEISAENLLNRAAEVLEKLNH